MIRLLIPNFDDDTSTTQITQKMLQDSFDLSHQILNLGYELTINIACANLLKNSEIENFCKVFKFIAPQIKCIYFADTYGSFDQHSIIQKINQFNHIQQKFNINIPIGFHAHNNCQDGLTKSLSAINNGIIMLDSCITGLGRGCGNLISEFLLLDLNKPIDEIIQYADKYYPDRLDKNNFLFFYAAKFNCHPNYVNELMDKNITFYQRCKILDKISKYSDKNNDYHYDKKLINQICN